MRSTNIQDEHVVTYKPIVPGAVMVDDKVGIARIKEELKLERKAFIRWCITSLIMSAIWTIIRTAANNIEPNTQPTTAPSIEQVRGN